MKITDAQFYALQVLAETGPKPAVEILLPPSMDGKRRVKLVWHLGNTRTLAALESAGLVTVHRQPRSQPKDATGRPGNPRRMLTISISDKGRAAIDGDPSHG